MTVTISGTAGITTPEIISTGGPLVVDASAPDNSVVVNSAGNVGIGTVSPSVPLQVSSAGSYKATFERTDGANSYVTFEGTSTTGNNGIGTSGDNVSIITGGTERMVVSSSGIITGTAGNLMLVQGTAVASTSGTAIGFTGIPSWAKRVTMVLQRVTTSSTAQWIVQIGSGSYATSGYESVSQTTYSGSGATISQTTGMAIFHNAAATYVSGTMTFTNISGNVWVQDHTTSYSVAGSNQGAGYTSLGGTLDRIQITTVGGANTFTGGSINIFYE